MLAFAIVGFFISLLSIVIIATKRHYRTVPNLLVCNTCLAANLFFCNTITICITGFHSNWPTHQSICVLRAYCVVMFCTAFIYSYMIQSISRFFFIVYYQKPYLRAWRIHWYMIICGWIISIVLPIEPLLGRTYIYQSEARLCIPTPQSLSSTLYLIIVSFFIPYHVIIFIYIYIIRHVHLLTKRIATMIVIDASTGKLAKKQGKELKILKSIIIQVGIYLIGVTPTILIMICSQIPTVVSIPDELYLLSKLSIPIFIMVILMFVCMTNLSLRKTLESCIRRFVGSH